MGKGRGKKDDDAGEDSSFAANGTKAAVGMVLLLMAVVGWGLHERSVLLAHTAKLHAQLETYSQSQVNTELSSLGYAGGVGSGGGGDEQSGEQLTSLREPVDEDITTAEAADGVLGDNGVVVGTMEDQGTANIKQEEGATQFMLCRDMSSSCEKWAREGECMTNKDWMLGNGKGFDGRCMKACGACDDSSGAAKAALKMGEEEERRLAGEQVNGGAFGGIAAGAQSMGQDPDTRGPITDALTNEATDMAGGDCQDLSADCKSWALHGECERNVDYMVGGNGYDGQCKFSCGKCKPVSREALDAGVPSADGMAEFEQKLMRQTPANPARPLRWPQKRTSAGRMCIGMSVNACSRGLYTPPSAPEVLDPADRTLQKGVGGPTGCTEAWATLVNSDDQIPGVLVMMYTLRLFSNEDRDLVVLVGSGVTRPYIDQLQAACVIIKKVSEPMDPATHMGFNKLNLWLAIEYSKMVFIEYDTWLRADPSEAFSFAAPASIKTAPHARLMNEMFGSYFFVLEPNRQTFYDMLGKVATIDSAEVVDDKTVYTERLFFSGYYEKWYILPSSFMEFQQDVVATVIPELTNTRLRRIITSMPPYSPETVLDFGLIQAHGIFANLHVKPWHPGWRITCAWECRYRKYHQLYEALAVEWWQHYFNLMDMPLPSERAAYALTEFHDPHKLYAKKEFEQCLPFNCDVPETFAFDPQAAVPTAEQPKQPKGRKLLTIENVGAAE